MRIAFIAGAVLALTGAAQAADTLSLTQTAPVSTWSGLYFGAQIGASSLNGTLQSLDHCDGRGICITDLTAMQVMGGAYAGFTLQTGSLVFGAEASVSGKSGGSVNNLTGFDAYMGDWMTSSPWEASVLGRVGVLVTPELLAYGTVGVTAAAFTLENATCPDCADWVDQNLHGDTRYGWTVGGGLEYSATPDFRLRGQATYTDFGTLETEASGSGNHYDSTLSSFTITTGMSLVIR